MAFDRVFRYHGLTRRHRRNAHGIGHGAKRMAGEAVNSPGKVCTWLKQDTLISRHYSNRNPTISGWWGEPEAVPVPGRSNQDADDGSAADDIRGIRRPDGLFFRWHNDHILRSCRTPENIRPTKTDVPPDYMVSIFPAVQVPKKTTFHGRMVQQQKHPEIPAEREEKCRHMNFSGTVRAKCSCLIKRDSHRKQQDSDKQITGKDDIFRPSSFRFRIKSPLYVLKLAL